MPIHIIYDRATPKQINQMLEELGIYICPRINNSMEILDPQIREQVAQVIFSRLGDV